jgi:hypothetical protein
MKYLISGLSVSVALAIALPAWAQAPTPPPQTRAVTGSGHRATTTTRHHVVRSQSQDDSAEQLNAQELSILQSGGPSEQRMPSGGRALTSPTR